MSIPIPKKISSKKGTYCKRDLLSQPRCRHQLRLGRNFTHNDRRTTGLPAFSCMPGPISLLYVAIVRNDDEAKVVAASSYDSHQLGKHSLKTIEDYVRQELGKDGEARRFEVAALSAYVTVEQVDLAPMGGRKWAVVVCATRAYTENNAINCGQVGLVTQPSFAVMALGRCIIFARIQLMVTGVVCFPGRR